jgi:integrase
MVDEEIIERNVARRVPYPKKVENVSQKVLGEGDLEAVFRAFKEEQRPKVKEGRKRGVYVWFKPVVALGFYGGLRLGEIGRLRWEEVDFRQGFILLRNTKNGQERLTPIQKQLRHYLVAWHRCCGRPRRGLVFCKSKRKGLEVPLELKHISKTFKRYVRAAKLPDGITFHGLRHTCVTNLMRAGFSESEVAKWVGHQSTAMTNRYTHLNHNDLQRKLQQLDL